MVKPRLIRNILRCAVLISLLISCQEIFADDGGQLININQNYQIAFTDLGSRVLKLGDIVKVTISTDDFVYLQVIESSAILSKLGLSKVDGYQTNLNDFQRLSVGNAVSKINAAAAIPDNSSLAPGEPKSSEETTLQLQVQKLETDLASAKEQVRILQESNEKSKATLNELIVQAQEQAKKEEALPPEQSDNSKEILSQLKGHLDNMNKIIEEND